MKSVDTGRDKVKKICAVLKRETLDPAREQADLIIRKAREEAAQIVKEAKRKAQALQKQAKKQMDEERGIFESSIHLACKKSLLTLRQNIEESLFHPELIKWVGKSDRDPHILAELISTIIRGIEKEGIDANLRALIPSSVSPDAVNRELAKGIIEDLEKGSVQVGEFHGGVQVKIVNQNITIDITDEALTELVASFVRDDFRSIVFSAV